MNKAEAQAWAAGLFLADGTVGIYENNHSGRVFHRVSFAVRMMDKEVIEQYNAIIDNTRPVRSYKTRSKRRGDYLMYSSETTSCDEVIRIGSWMIPLLVGRKKERFQIVVKLCEDIRRHKGKGSHSEKTIKYRQELYDACQRAGATTK